MPPPALRLSTFGALSLETGSGDTLTQVLSQPKRLGILIYLAVARPRGLHRRDAIVELFWPEFDESRARNALSQSLSYLRRNLPEGVILTRGAEEIGVSQTSVHCDVTAFDNAIRNANWGEGLDLYQGDFLRAFHVTGAPGFEDWMYKEQARLRDAAAGAAWALAKDQVVRGAFQEGERSALRALSLGGPRERTAREFLVLMAEKGERVAALSFFNRFRSRLAEELELAPTPELEALMEELRSGSGTGRETQVHSSTVTAEPDTPTIEPERAESRDSLEARSSPTGRNGDALEGGLFPYDNPAPRSSVDDIPPFVNRDGEMDRLRRQLDAALAGSGCLAFIAGEAGAGKTALAREFARRAAEEHSDLVVAYGSGNAYVGPGDPYLPFREALGALTGDLDPVPSRESPYQTFAARLWEVISVSVPALSEWGPDLPGTVLDPGRLQRQVSTFCAQNPDRERLLSSMMKNLEHRPRRKPPPALGSQILRTLRAIGRVHPVVMVLDDLQWVDAGSAELLFHLGRRLAGARILILCLFRPSDLLTDREGGRQPVERVAKELQRGAGTIEINLDEANPLEMVEGIIDSRPNVLGPGFRNALCEQTQGNPLFTIELLRSMQERGVLRQDESGRWSESPNLDWNVLPRRVEVVLEERIARLSEGVHRLLSTASVEGWEFTLEALALVLKEPVGVLSDLVNRQLADRQKMVVSMGIRRANGQRIAVYRFRDRLLQRILYSRLDASERARLHEEYGYALESIYGERKETVASKIAYHFSEAGLPDSAASYLLVAGERAFRSGAYPEAIEHLESSLGFLLSLPTSTERDTQELDTQLLLGNARFLHLAPEREQPFLRARELAEGLRDDMRLGEALLGIWMSSLSAGDLAKAEALAARCLSIAEREGDVGLLLRAHDAAGRVASAQGQFRRSEEHYQKLLSLYRPEEHSGLVHLAGVELGSVANGMIALAKLRLGYPDQAMEWSQNAVSLARERRGAIALTYVLLYETLVRLGLGDFPKALEAVEAWKEANAEAGKVEFWRPWIELSEGCCRGGMGNSEEGIRLIRSGLEKLQASGERFFLTYWTAWAALTLSTGGQTEDGLRILNEAFDPLPPESESWTGSEFLRVKGELLLALRRPKTAEAEACFRDAIQVAQSQEAKWYELRATTSLARLLAKSGREDEGREMLSGIYDWFVEGFDTKALKEASALLSKL